MSQVFSPASRASVRAAKSDPQADILVPPDDIQPLFYIYCLSINLHLIWPHFPWWVHDIYKFVHRVAFLIGKHSNLVYFNAVIAERFIPATEANMNTTFVVLHTQPPVVLKSADRSPEPVISSIC
jgi:hypothetical protein